jgi:hypothetical protein
MGIVSSLVLATMITWTGVDTESHLGGRKVSQGYLQGKVVLVYKWDKEHAEHLARLQEVWESFRSKQFMLIGSYRGESAAEGEESAALKAMVKKSGVTFAVYCGAGYAGEPKNVIYVVDGTGACVWRGSDERLAEEAVVKAITNLAYPADIGYYKRLLKKEKDTLKGRTWNHLKELEKRMIKDKKFAKTVTAEDKKEFAALKKELKANKDIEKLGNLVEFARIARDYNPKARKQKVRIDKSKINATIKAGEVLLKSEDPVVVQEVKNSLADLKMAAAAW